MTGYALLIEVERIEIKENRPRNAMLFVIMHISFRIEREVLLKGGSEGGIQG